jgi:hypothetical protein
MIEREARAPGDRAKVAAVIYNRLHRGMNLGIDATILYHLGSWSATIHQSDIDSHEPYNTRTNPGLPPTPISNPGLASIEAAAHPAHVNYLYYVAVPGKDAQYFTASYADFKAMAAEAARRGDRPSDRPLALAAMHAAAYAELGMNWSTRRSTCRRPASPSSRVSRPRASRHDPASWRHVDVCELAPEARAVGS